MKLLKEENNIKYYEYDNEEERDRHIHNMKAIGYIIFAKEDELHVAYSRQIEVKVEDLN